MWYEVSQLESRGEPLARSALGRDARKLGDPLEHVLVEERALVVVGVIFFREFESDREDMVGAKPEVGGLHAGEAAQEQAGADEQHERKGDLGDDERFARARRGGAVGAGAAAAWRQRRSCAGRAPRPSHAGPEAKDQRGQHGEPARRREHAAIDGDGLEARDARGAQRD